MTNEELYALSDIKGIGPKAITIILQDMKENEIDTIQNLDIDILLNNTKLSRYKKILKENLNWDIFKQYIDDAENLFLDIKNKQIDIVSILDENYPKLLKITQNPPLFLYCKGNLSLLNNLNNIAVVGTRQNTPLGQLITTKSVKFMCDNNYTIVSGLALGIDAIAHQAALDFGGKTIAVLVDVDNIQPQSNRKLASDILDNDGLLIAEMTPNIKIIPSMFVRRDRIQSGLSLSVFAIETNIDGGTMNAVKTALKENRLVYTPDINKSGYTNTNISQLQGIKYLIKEGKAIPYTKSKYANILSSLELKKKLLNLEKMTL